ncbi:FG-GAP repeat-containing protein [Calothrix sp. NIES-4071]|nr:FG-GAP repeat-containing protein [Calothrix sp. NIES-4071]BAZ54562.1 FG-GAP repeat-containing protein [Calothrix sp. NIES-4105]
MNVAGSSLIKEDSGFNKSSLKAGNSPFPTPSTPETPPIATAATAAAPSLDFAIKSEGIVTVNGSSDFDGIPTDYTDDALIYAGKGFNFNGNPILPVQRDAALNPIRDASGKQVLIDKAVVVAAGYTISSSPSNQYAGLNPPQVVPTQTINVPTYASIRDAELAKRIQLGAPTVTFNIALSSIKNANDWNSKFPSPGTATNPKVVRVVGGALEIPNNVDISNYVITVETGDISFKGNNQNVNNVVFVANNGSIDLGRMNSLSLSAFASGSITMNSQARFKGATILANGSSTGSIAFNGASTSINATDAVKVISQGKISFSGASNTRGYFTSADEFTFNSSSTLYGTIAAKGNVTFNGSSVVIYAAELNTDTTAPTITASLLLDTAPSHTTNNDKITSDPTIIGSVTDTSSIAEFKAGFNNTQEANFTNILAQRNPDGSFRFTRGQLESIYGGTLPDGTHTLKLQAKDAFGNTTNIYEFTFTLDTTSEAPSLLDLIASSDSGQSNTDNITKNTTPSITGKANAGAGVQLFKDQQVIGQATADSAGSWQITSSTLTNGSYTLTAIAIDVAGNVSAGSQPLNITIDTVEPNAPSNLKLTAATDTGINNSDNITKNPTPVIQGLAEANSTVKLYKNGQLIGQTSAATNGEWQLQVELLGNGQHTFTATAEDAGGNVSSPSAQFTVTIDTEITTPTLNLIATSDSGQNDTDDITNDSTPTFTGNADAGSTVRLFNNTELLGQTTANNNGTWEITTSTLTNGNYNLTAVATDIAGNASTKEPPLSITVDTVSPQLVLAAPIDTAPLQASARLLGSVDGTGSAITALSYRFNNLAEIPVFLNADGTFNQQINFAGLGNGAYILTLTATDTAGNTTTTPYNITVNLDTEAPLISAKLQRDTASGNTTNSDKITSDPSIIGNVTDSSSIAEFKAGFDNTPVTNFVNIINSLQSNGSFSLNRSQLEAIYGGSIPDGIHTLRLVALDIFGNESNVFEYTFSLDTTTAAPSNLDLPAFSDTGSSNSDSITNKPNVTIIGNAEALSNIKLFNSGQLVGEATTDSTSSWEIITNNLVDGTYNFSAIATDIAGNVSSSSTPLAVTIDSALPLFTFTTQPDVAPLATGAKLTGSVDGTGTPIVALSYRFDILPEISIPFNAAGAFDSEIDFAGISNGAHTLTIIATDTAGNVRENQYNVTVNRDISAPVVSVGLVKDTARSGSTNTDRITSDPTITGTVIDASNVVDFRAGFDTTSTDNFVNVLPQRTSDGKFKFSRTQLETIYGGALRDGIHTLRLFATDSEGNKSAVVDFTFTLDTSAPTEPVFSIDPALISSNNKNLQTTASAVTLTGQTEAGATVVLKQTNITAIADSTGKFQFTGLNLLVGANAFSFRITDVAGNATDPISITITRASNNDVVLDWNATLLQAVQTDRSAPPLAARNMAMVHAAVYDAVNSITHKYSSYKVDIPAPVGASTSAAAAAAAYRVLVNLYPQQQITFDSAYSASLAAIPDGQSETDGVTVGLKVADAILAWRSNDGANAVKAYSPGTNPGEWQPTPPSYGGATLSQWGDVKTFAMTSSSQFRPSDPPALNSDKYTTDFNQVKEIGKIDSTTRTAEQTEIALFWADNPGTYTPPGHWNQIAEQVAVQQGSSLEDNARLFALLNIGLADAGISCWDTKYTYNFWRPITAIRNADTDGNLNTISDPNWTPLLVTPSFPDYTSGHSTFSGVADAVLTNIYGNNFNFSTTTVGLPGVTRSFNSFTTAAEEAGISRIYGGIHFNSANTSGLASGRALGNYITQNFLKTKVQTGLIIAALANDTSPNGTNTDSITSDATVAGKITIPNNGNIRLRAAFGNTAVTNYRDITAQIGIDGSFTLSNAQIATIYGAAIPDGVHQLKLRLEDTLGNLLSNTEVAFTLDTGKPTLFLDVPSSLGSITSKARLIGNASDTGSAISSARYRIDGQQAYAPLTSSTNGEFSQVIVPTGLTAGQHSVELEVFDTAGNSTKTNTNFTVSNDFFVGGTQTEGWGSKTDNSVVLAEQNSFVTQTAMTVKLGQPAGKRVIEFDLDAKFDTTDTTVSEDRFAVYLVDTNNPTQTLLDRGEKGTALFSLTGQNAEYTAGLVTYDGRRVRIDVTTLANKTSGSLLFQLINNDGDTGSVVSVKNLTNTLDIKGSASPVFPTQNNRASVGGAIANLNTFTNTSNAKLHVTNVRLDTTTGKYTALLQVENIGTTTLSRQLAVLLTSLPSGVNVTNASGTHPAGSPYINLSNAIRPGGLEKGTISDAVQIEFNDPQLLRFEIQPVVLAGTPEQGPMLQNPGSLTVKPGERLAIPLVASDPNGDPITFSIRSDKPLPKGKLSGDGKLVFNPSPDEVGTYNLTLVAISGGVEATQNVTLNVAPDPITTTRISGVIQNTDQAPLAGIVIELAGRQVLTAADGSFQLEFTGAIANDTLKVRANQLNSGNVVYPFIAEKLPLVLEHEVYTGVNNVIERPIYLPPLDIANGKNINPNADTTISSPLLPGSAVYVAAGSLKDQNGNPFTGKLSITEVPPSLTPAALPENLRPDVVVTIQPGEMVFNTPARLSLPNRAGYAAGLEMDLWSINPNTGLFDKVGVGKVSADGKVIETISGGIRNSSWHFFAPPPLEPNPPEELNKNNKCKEVKSINSEVELDTGSVTETHDLVTYQSLGETRGVSLTYNSLRANPTEIVHFGYDNVPLVREGTAGLDPRTRLVAKLTLKQGDFKYTVPGASPGQYGLTGGEHFWSIPNFGGAKTDADAALQVDMQSLASGRYSYDLTTGLQIFTGETFAGSSATTTGTLININTINSAFGSGWGLAGLQEIVRNTDGSLLLIDGNGSYLLFEAPTTPSSAYVSPVDDFSTLERLADGTFRRTMKDRTVYQFNAQNKLELMRDPNGNETRYVYNAAGQITLVVDPVGLATTFTYTNSKVSSITDPGGRVTKLEYDTEGNLIKITDPDTYTRQWEYDNKHHMTAATDKKGNRGQDFYDFAGRVYKAITKDGSVIQVNPVEVQGLYRNEQTINPSTAPIAKPLNNTADASYADGNGNVVRTLLDQRGQMVTATDGAGFLPTVERNANNLVTKSTNAKGNVTTYTYDARGNVLTVFDELSQFFTGSVDFSTKNLFPNRIYKTGDNPQQIIAADLNGDGHVDVASANANSNNISVLLGDGKGTFSTPTNYTVGSSPNSLITTDIDGDGKLDLIVANRDSNNISVLFGDGLGTFGTAINYAVGSAPSSIAVADINSDGLLDLVVANRDSNNLSVLLGNSEEIFSPATNLNLGSQPNRVTLGDLDGDGKADIVVTTGVAGTNNSVSVLLNNGNGIFTLKTDYAVGNFPLYVTLGDINSDGKADIVTANYESNSVSVLLNLGNGAFGTKTDYAVGYSPTSVVLGDVNGDKLVDILTANASDNTVSVLLNNGSGAFTPKTNYAVGGAPSSITIADANSDGKVDVITANSIDNSVSVLFGNGNGTMNATIEPSTNNYSVISAPKSVVLYDVTSDGILDMVTNNPETNTVSVSFGNGDGSFSPAFNYAVGDNPQSVYVADVSGDGKVDLVVANTDSNLVSVLFNNGQGIFSAATNSIVKGRPNSIAVGDVNSDAKADLITTTPRFDSISILLGNGQGRFITPTDISLGFTPNKVNVSDLNGDGKLDIIVSGTNGDNNYVSTLLNNGNGTFAPKVNYLLASGSFEFSLGNINSDGSPDIIIANPNNNSVSVLLNKGNGTFGVKTDVSVGISPVGVQIGDINKDGFVDIISANSVDYSVSVLLGSENGSFDDLNRLDFAIGNEPISIAVGELNGDGFLDLVTGNLNDNTVSVRLNKITTSGVSTGTGERRYTYDPIYNQVTSETDELGRKTLYEIDPLTGNMLSITKVVGAVGGDDDVVTRYTYTSKGQIDTMTDALGRVTDYDYNFTGRLIKTTFAKGTVDEVSQQFEYDSAGNQTAIIDEKGNRTEFQYNSMNMLVKTIGADPDGAGPLASPVTSYTYDKDGNQTSVTDARNLVATSDYDDMGRLVKTTDEKGGITRYVYDKAGNQVSVIDPLGRETNSIYDARNRLVETINSDGSSYKPKYDFDNNLTSNIDANGNRTNKVYDARGRLIREINALGNITRYEYDAANQLIAQIDGNGNKTRYKYDDLGRQTEVIDALGHITKIEYDKVGNVVVDTDTLGRKTRYTYDNRNRQKVLTDALSYTTTTNYDAVGNTIAIADQLGRITQFTYDAQNRQTSITDPLNHTTTYTYDAVNNLADITDANGRTTQYGYDALNRRTTVTNALGDTATTIYDAVGNTTAITDELGRTTKFTYDKRDRVTATIDPLEHKITRVYDANDNLTAVTDANGQTTRYGYDALNRRYSVTDARNKTTTTTYDAVGKVSTITDPVGNTTAYSYDTLNRLVAEKNQLGKVRSYEYDAVGNQVAADDRNGRKRAFTYDVLNRQTAEKWLDATGNVIATMNYTYDAFDQLISASDSNSSYTYTYDGNGRLTRANNTGTLGVPNVILGYTYDAVGNLLNVTDTINGTQRGTESFTYDALNRVTRITQAGNGVTTKRVDMAYDKANQLKSITRYASAAGTQLVADSIYNYDLAGRLTNLTHKRGTTNLAAYTFDYDAANRITKSTSPDGSSDYSYDATNQLVGTDHSFQTDESYSYDANGNRTNAGYQNGTDNRLLSDGKYNYEYDSEGNRTKRIEIATGKIREYTWDYGNRLIKVVDKDVLGSVTKQADYTYDVFGNRIAKYVDADGAGNTIATVERFVYDGDHIALTFDGNGTQTHRYMHGLVVDQILASENATGQVSWALTDNQGSVRDVVDSAGAVINHITYDSFGQITNQSNPTASIRFGYTGREFDTETGDYYYRARYYDPAVGEFISEDPIGFAGGDANLYRYVANSPVNGTDPTGNQPTLAPLPPTPTPTPTGFSIPGVVGGVFRKLLGPVGAILLQPGGLLNPLPVGDLTVEGVRRRRNPTPTPTPTPTFTPDPNPTSTPIPVPQPDVTPVPDPNCKKRKKTCETPPHNQYDRADDRFVNSNLPFGGYRFKTPEQAQDALNNARVGLGLPRITFFELQTGREATKAQCKAVNPQWERLHYNVYEVTRKGKRAEQVGSIGKCTFCFDEPSPHEEPRYMLINVKDRRNDSVDRITGV